MSESQEGNGVILVDLKVPYLRNVFFLDIINFVERRTVVSFTVGTWNVNRPSSDSSFEASVESA